MEKEGSSSSGMDAQWSEVPVSSPNRRVRQRAEREMGGGGWLGATRRKENGREGGGGSTRHGSTECGVRMAPGGAVGGDSVCSRRRRAGEQGRAARRGRRGAVRLTGGARRQWVQVSAVGHGWERGKRGSTAVGRR
jgi:hypothetical protein